MRIIIKNADFSEVSIGKVVEYLSFEYRGQGIKNAPWANIVDKTVSLPWTGGSSNVSATEFLLATNEAVSYTPLTNNQRIVTDFIEVVEGMTISLNIVSVNNTPAVICYNANQQPLGPSSTYCLWASTSSPTATGVSFTIPAGVKYIKIQASGVGAQSTGGTELFIKGAMPS